MPDDSRQHEVMSNIQSQKPGAKAELRRLREDERMMAEFMPSYDNPERSAIVRHRRDIYEKLNG